MHSVKSPHRYAVLAVVVCCASAWISGEQLRLQADIWSSGAAGGWLQRVCAATAPLGFSCMTEARAEGAFLPVPVPELSGATGVGVRMARVPLAFVGLAYFVLLGVWLVLIERGMLPGVARWLRLVCGGGALFSVGCLVAMAGGWAPRCAACLAVHLLNGIVIAVIYRGVRPDRRTEVARNQALRATALASLLIGALWIYRAEHVALGKQIQGLLPYRAQVQALRDDAGFLLREHYAQPVALDAAPRRGRLVVFTDYACPTCACTTNRVDREIDPLFGGDLQIEFRHYPLDATCNDNVRASVHPGACTAAYAAEAAWLQGGAEARSRMASLLYARRGRVADGAWSIVAAEAGLDVARFETDLMGADVRARVAEDVALAQKLRITGTPAMFLDGRPVGPLCADNAVFWEAIADEYAATEHRIAAAEAKEGQP